MSENNSNSIRKALAVSLSVISIDLEVLYERFIV